MKAKYKIGDRFIRKNTCDSFPMVIEHIVYQPYEVVYTINNWLNTNQIVIGEEALDEQYRKIEKETH